MARRFLKLVFSAEAYVACMLPAGGVYVGTLLRQDVSSPHAYMATPLAAMAWPVTAGVAIGYYVPKKSWLNQ